MTRMTENGVTTTKAPGQEQWEYFKSRVQSKMKPIKQHCQYDYRHTDGELFSCVKPTLADCRAARDEWLKAKGAAI